MLVVYFLYALGLPVGALFLLIYSFLRLCLSKKKKKFSLFNASWIGSFEQMTVKTGIWLFFVHLVKLGNKKEMEAM